MGVEKDKISSYDLEMLLISLQNLNPFQLDAPNWKVVYN
jgi:hypothetical protein